ncbi:peptidyl-prolyl cis-trans isomerase B (cyclophilin B) [Pedobacter sp. AK017]|uniref:peptidylprolyl isomerase n=1 Tax=Pedobacter sp. AK017 TaxID=2723073 RepID=UPI00160973CE|nr:peptidylprolyl isomerase [Pedobacter sp. AK017]MBB5437168.1 peptidyl-prolyl cis-trans isomerase B (cyclophilin B) [Pedobacter sp. AK017]
MKNYFTIILCLCFISAFSAKPKYQYVKIKTTFGECIIKLYNETPQHRDNFLKLAAAGTYDGTLFHRVIKDFMIQGGDPDSKTALPGALLGEGTVGYTVPAEFRDSLFHKKGVLAAARDNNPEKASSGCQFYLVQGKIFTDQGLDDLENKRLNFKIPLWQREIYKTIGGTPHLDHNYTVYGEVVKGMELIDSIAVVKTDSNNRPLEDVKMTVTVLKRSESRKLEKEIAKLEKAAHTSSQKKNKI